jgi:hypothetical protein
MRGYAPHFQSKSKSKSQKKAFFLMLTENAGWFAPHLSMEGEAFRLKKIWQYNILI